MAQRQLYSGLDLYDWRGTGPNGRTKAVDVDKWQQNQEDIRHLPGAFPVQSVVITDGQITPTAAALSVDTEGGAPADDLTAIAPGDLHAGMLLALCSVDTGRKVTIKNSAGASGIQTLDGKDVVLDTQYAVMLRLVSTGSLSLWREEPGPLRLQLPVATSTTLGGVKVQSGDDDGLEMIGDKLRARQATTTQRGSVLASETAQAGTVPTADGNGRLDESWLKAAMLPVGTLIPSFATSMAGCLLGNGAAVSRTTYKELFALFGTKFGAGDGSTTFNLPDFRDRTLWGANGNLMEAIAAGLPDAEGGFTVQANSWSGTLSVLNFSGVFKESGGRISGTYPEAAGYSANYSQKYTLSLSNYNDIYGKSNTVQPPSIGVNIFIKY